MSLHAHLDMSLYHCIYILIYGIYISGINAQNIISDCERTCEESLTKESLTGNYFCNNDCKLLQCKVGCQNYNDAISSSCLQTCTQWTTKQGTSYGTRNLQTTERQYCVQGCGDALKLYTDKIAAELGVLPAPELKRESKSFSSVTLHWNGVVHPNVTYYVQIRNIDTNSDWMIDNTTTIDTNGDILVDHLRPYVTYKFKILLVLTKTDMLATPASLNITTLPNGVPSSAPKITDVSVPTPTVISVSWQPPMYTNGPLLGYRLNLHPVNHSTLHPVTLEVPGNITNWTFRQLQSSQLYVVSIKASNSDGEGLADAVNITTPSAGNLTADELPYLILGEDNRVLKLNMKLITDLPDKVVKKAEGIYVLAGTQILNELPPPARPTGIGVHTKRQLAVVSTSDNKVCIVSVYTKEVKNSHAYPTLTSPTAISVDWLNDVVYIVNEYNIYKCQLYNDKCIIATGPLPTVPNDLKVDPVNGYLYFTQGSPYNGLYRIDLGEITPTIPAPYKQVLRCHLKAFSLDYQNMQLYFPNETLNTMMSSFLDGTDIKDLRKNKVIRPDFQNLQSMVHYDGLFYWTDGTHTVKEDYEPDSGQFYHNPLLFSTHNYAGFNIYQQSSQPMPVPNSPPDNIQALFTSAVVYIHWEKPKKLSYQGAGAWDSWQYEVSVLEDDGSNNIALERTANQSFEVANLEPDTSYQIKVRALSATGKGPWSNVFVGRTLTQDSSSATVIMAEYDPVNHRTSVVESDLYGKNLKPIKKVGSLFNRRINDLSWYKNTIIWVTSNRRKVFMYDKITGIEKHIMFMKDAACLAYDWLGQKLYWSVPNLGVIRRADITGNDVEFVIQGSARRLAIDSINGRLYWVTTNSLESSYLNGDDHMVYFSVPFFSGKQVISLTLNFDLQKVLWYVKGFERQDLYMSDLIRDGVSQDQLTIKYIGSFRSISETSGLQYYSHRIFWQNTASAVVVGDIECNYTSVISSRKVSIFSVRHHTLQKYPDGLNETTLKIIPDKIPEDGIKTVGDWSIFNLTWSPAVCNHGNVFYEVSIQIPQDQTLGLMLQTQNPWYEVTRLAPYTMMLVTIRAFTYWGYGPITTATVYSPMSVPSKPLTPRVYVTQHKDSSTSQNSLAADFRWSTPTTINGIITKHIVYHWTSDNNGGHDSVELPSTNRHFILNGLLPNSSYHFQVSACTAVGCGEKSDAVKAKADAVNPVPKLLRVSKTSIVLTEVDSGGNVSVDITASVEPIALSFLAQDDRMFWINKEGSLIEWNKKEKNQVELMHLNKTGHGLSLDWISRTLYITEADTSGQTGSIRAYRLDQHVQTELVTNRQAIGNIIADPYRSTIIWTEKAKGKNYHLLYKMTNGQEVVTLFNQSNKNKRSIATSCNCPTNVKAGPVVTMDTSLDRKMEVMYYDERSHSIMATDGDSCRCRKVISKGTTSNNGLPPDLLTVDHLHVYWYNKKEQTLYTLHKTTGDLTSESVPDVQDIVAYGAHLQPLPSSECLDPEAYSGTVDLVQRTNTSIKVRLQEVTWPQVCDGISHPDTKYTVYYSAGTKGDNCGLERMKCQPKTSYIPELVIDGLSPYTSYVLHGAVSNYYTEYLSEALGQPVFYQTKVGVPSAVRNIEAEVLSPEQISVKWFLPAIQNGPMEDLRYIIKFSTQTSDGKYLEDTTNSSAVVAEYTEKNITKNYKVDLQQLRPDHLYTITVLASNVHNPGLYTASTSVERRTYQLPNNFTTKSISSTGIHLYWWSPSDNSVVRNKIQIAELSEGKKLKWLSGPFFLVSNYTRYNISFYDLRPHTKYTIRVNTLFRSKLHFFSWPHRPEDFTIMTDSSIPEQPPPPEVIALKTGGYEVVWLEPYDSGDTITNYLLQYREEGDQHWKQAYNNSVPRWVIDEEIVPSGYDYRFRVAAQNSIGTGNFSENSTVFMFPAKQVQQGNIAVLAVSLSFVFIFITIVILAVCYAWRKRQEEKKKPTQFIAIARGPDLELATLRELPHTAFQQSNTLYAFNTVPTPEDIIALPHFSRDQLMLTKFLGSGAFGEVFEGLAKNIISDSSGETRVAVKTLRKSASDHEKEEFLKEALLMSNFKHLHILSLLGVCLDNDPQFIILELMEGGDLLTFLRASRPSSVSPSYLCLPDLLKICVDVAKGCKYLEEMHFVHRDLAARNCLVSSKNPSEMIVKIGDFGLARDIYKNDYYRKEGEGLLPVRWMSPESLVDGVFTTQSDIWAFAVLVWEVLTFGQQPYPARTNVEVLQFVRAGGQLDQPENCPQEIYQLLTKCWNFAAEDRPNFTFILQQLDQFYQKCLTLLSDYIMPVRSRPPPQADVDGYLPQDQINERKRKPRTLSLGHDDHKKSNGKVVHRTIQHATSFDSPEPRDTSIQEASCFVAMQHSQSSDYIHPNTYGTPKYIEIICGPDEKPYTSSHSTSDEKPYALSHPAHDKKPYASSHSTYSKVDKLRKSSQSSCATSEKQRKVSQSSRHSSTSSDIYGYPLHSGLRVALPQDKNKQYEQIHSLDTEPSYRASYVQINTIPSENSIPSYAKVRLPTQSVSSNQSEDSSVFLSPQASSPSMEVLNSYDTVDYQANKQIPPGYKTVKYPSRPIKNSGSSGSGLQMLPGNEVVDYRPSSVDESEEIDNEIPPEYDSVNFPPKSINRNNSSELELPPGYDIVDFPFKPIVSYKNSINNNNIIIQKVPSVKGGSYSAEMCLNYDKPKPNRVSNSAEARLCFPKYCRHNENIKNGSIRIFENMMPLTDSKNYVDCNKASYLSSSSKSSSNCSMSHVDNQNSHLYWANNNVDLTRDGRGGHMNHGKSRSQVYPENSAMMNGIDMVQASLV